ncbi:hypothetical protein T4B_1378 [Trichinella pseudospiralis]|uniref:Uncharacterized protein n=1 Tax=Trichinella pseudospiralis TaxID=6337 RepID=A0A0V1GAQ4_TRIPS|nr:hypothetical protein T4B_1378 [Trichinella pseudospiralis]
MRGIRWSSGLLCIKNGALVCLIYAESGNIYECVL